MNSTTTTSTAQTPATDLWGQDIALDAAGQALVAANGELVLTDLEATGVQDIRLRLFTRLGSLFYDSGFGSLIHDWILEESTPQSRAALCAEVVMRVELDPRVVVGSVAASILTWNEKSVCVDVRWRFIDVDQPLNLVFQADKITKELVIADVAPREQSLDPIFSAAAPAGSQY